MPEPALNCKTIFKQNYTQKLLIGLFLLFHLYFLQKKFDNIDTRVYLYQKE